MDKPSIESQLELLSGTPEEKRARLEQIKDASEELNKLIKTIGEVFIDPDKTIIRDIVACQVAGGHFLGNGPPGTGKTHLMKTVARSMSLQFKRVQCTPDKMASDITGSEILTTLEDGTRGWKFKKGPIFTNILLGDEVNRTPPKTQAALLEGMEEGTVTTNDGDTLELPKPFMLLATKNPIEQDGTYPLPEAQLDRFMMQVHFGYPRDKETEKKIALLNKKIELTPVFNAARLLEIQEIAKSLPLSDLVVDRSAEIVRSLRPGEPGALDVTDKYVEEMGGPSNRAVTDFIRASRALALIDFVNTGRLDPTPNHIAELVQPLLEHRMKLNFKASNNKITFETFKKPLMDILFRP